jgi:hypothetical protein
MLMEYTRKNHHYLPALPVFCLDHLVPSSSHNSILSGLSSRTANGRVRGYKVGQALGLPILLPGSSTDVVDGHLIWLKHQCYDQTLQILDLCEHGGIRSIATAIVSARHGQTCWIYHSTF